MSEEGEGGGGGGGGEGSDKGVVSLVANLVLLGSATWGIKTCYEHPFITAGFGIFAARGLLGTISYFDIKDETFQKVKNQVFKFVDNFGFPLLAMDIMSCKCMRPGFSLLQLLGPTVDFISYELEYEKTVEVLNISHAMTAGSVITCGQQKLEYWGNILFPIPFIADNLIKKLTENEDFHEPCLALGCLLVLYQNESLRSSLKKNLGRLDHALYNLSYPLFSLEVMNTTKFEPKIIKLFLLLFPVLELTVLNLEKSAVNASHGASAVAVIICDFQQSHWYYTLSLLGFTAEESAVTCKISEAARIMVMAATIALYAALINETIPILLLDDS